MKLNRTYLFIAISSAALLFVLIIQVNWIFKTASIKEELFNEKANMVLSRTTEALRADKETCSNIGESVENDSSSDLAAKLGNSEVHKIDSLFTYYLKYYNFHIDYTFVVLKPGSAAANNQNGFTRNSYNKPLEEVSGKNGIELKLIFPEKKQFIIAELGILFITSVILILIVLVLFWRTITSLIKEKKISDQTTDLINNMTHEFNTPITNIALAGKMILKNPAIKQEEKLKHYSEIILEENEKLSLQVEQVLHMTALEKGEISIQREKIDIHELIKHAIKSFSIQIENREGIIKLAMNSERHTIMGDRTHLTNVLCNLIDNALKYSKGKPEIYIQSSNIDQNLILVVSDNGLGIGKEYQKKIFDKYFRVPAGDVHNVKGFGLGLAYIKKIVAMHGGTIELHSDPGKGTTFTLILPNA